jgi:hypothetical protein
MDIIGSVDNIGPFWGSDRTIMQILGGKNGNHPKTGKFSRPMTTNRTTTNESECQNQISES